MRTASVLSLGGAALLVASSSSAQPLNLTYQNGLVSVECMDAPLSGVFQQIEEKAGVELILEDGVKSKRLTASLTDVPLAMAVQRLLEGAGVNYIVMMDPFDWDRVGKIFVGSGGGGPARAASAPAPVMPEEPVEEPYDEAPADFVEGAEGEDFGDAMDPGVEAPPDEMPQTPEELAPEGDPGEFPPPGSSPLPDFLPPPQSFPRSNFTPGLPSRSQQRQQTPPPGVDAPTPEDPSNVPPATFPFTDPFGRPIPIPPGMNPQQQQQQQQQNRRNQQRQPQE